MMGFVTRVALAGAFSVSATVALAQEACGLCEKEVTTTPELAKCFLEQYPNLSSQTGQAVAVDLSACTEETRGVVEALPTPTSGVADPDVEFMITRTQLDCLKKKLEDPTLKIDPTATIPLDAC